MVYLFIAIALVLVIAVGLISVGDAVGKTQDTPDQIVVDAHEAIEFCAEALPSQVTAELSYDQLRRLIRLHLEWVQAFHWAPSSTDAMPIVFEQYDPLSYIMERAAVVDLDVDEDTAAAVITAHTDYLVVAGALHIDDPAEVSADLQALPLMLDSNGADVAALEQNPEEPQPGPHASPNQ